jgi:hypothetical protein
MMSHLPRWFRAPGLVAFIAFGITLASCATWKKLKFPGSKSREAKAMDAKKHASATPAPRPLFVGTITLVNETSRFVLIDVGDSVVPAQGMALKSIANGVETGVVAVGDVKRRPFAIADIVSGSPKKGDAVYQ